MQFQEDVIHKMIYDPCFGIKACPQGVTAVVRALAAQAIDFFRKQKADAVILGCTELSLLFPEERIGDMLVVDAMEVLARALVREASGNKLQGMEHAFGQPDTAAREY
jgi:aspartate racemase